MYAFRGCDLKTNRTGYRISSPNRDRSLPGDSGLQFAPISVSSLSYLKVAADTCENSFCRTSPWYETLVRPAVTQ